jgi:hypothetical protein
MISGSFCEIEHIVYCIFELTSHCRILFLLTGTPGPRPVFLVISLTILLKHLFFCDTNSVSPPIYGSVQNSFNWLTSSQINICHTVVRDGGKCIRI